MRLARAAAAVSAALASAGCAAAAHPAPHATGHVSHQPAQLTIAQARRVVSAFLPRFKPQLPLSYSPARSTGIFCGQRGRPRI